MLTRFAMFDYYFIVLITWKYTIKAYMFHLSFTLHRDHSEKRGVSKMQKRVNSNQMRVKRKILMPTHQRPVGVDVFSVNP